ncbi:MAG: hypothetical protein ACREUR_05965 [Nitrosospira sp.]
MSGLGIAQWIITALVLFVVPFWRICERAGFKPAFSLLVLVPGGILILVWTLAFAKWPILAKEEHEEEEELEQREEPEQKEEPGPREELEQKEGLEQKKE